MTQKSVSFSDVAIGAILRNYYRFHLWDIIKSEILNMMKNVDVSGKGGEL